MKAAIGKFRDNASRSGARIRAGHPSARRATAIFAVVTVAAVSCSQAQRGQEKTCSQGAALEPQDIFGTSIPPKTLALTFDDGPGARTGELSTYLKEQGIRATFFVNGRRLVTEDGGANTTQLAQLVADGHSIGNHTQTHASLTGRSTGGPHLSDANTVAELAETDALIAPFVADQRFLFRAPYGDYDQGSFAALQASPMKKYVGPINWDIGDHMGPNEATDWDCWQPGTDGAILSVKACGDLYLEQIVAVGRGIVLMHDPYFIDDDVHKGGTVDMIFYLVPLLKAQGFSFVRLDEIPDIAALLPKLPPPDAGSGDAEASDASANDAAAPDAGEEPVVLPPASNPPPGDAAEAGGNTEPCPPSPQAVAAPRPSAREFSMSVPSYACPHEARHGAR